MLSVVICTYNPREEYLNRAIGCILGQDCRRQEYEFFIVDNNSVHPVAKLAIVKKNRIRVVKEPRQGLTAARECAVRQARGDILVFVDDDNLLDKSYLRIVKKLFRNRSIGVLSGQVSPEYEVSPPKWFYRFEETLAIRKFPGEHLYLTSVPVYSHHFPIGAGMCVRKELLNDYFNSISEANRIEGRSGDTLSSGEDIDIDLFAISRGYLVGVARPLKLTHIIPAVRTSLKYLQRLGKSSMQSCYLINSKWKPFFGANVFRDFDRTKREVLIKTIQYTLFYPLKRFRVGYVYYRSLHSLSSSLGDLNRNSAIR
jgi:glycosyltransferase involved in cell wall biosynthesis